jgi:hypothetical protein
MLQPDEDPIDAHGYPINWYAKATEYPNTQDGLAWTPALGITAPQLANSYTQDWQSVPEVFQDQYETRLQGDDGSILNNSPYSTSQGVQSLVHNTTLPLDASPTPIIRSVPLDTVFTTGTVSTTSSDVRLSENGNAVWIGDFTIEPGDQSLNFDYQFLNPGSGADLGIWVDNDLLVVLTGADAGMDLQSSEFDISDFSPGPHSISIGLYTYGNGDAVVDVSNLTITSVPEPTALLLLSGIILLPLRRKRVTSYAN